MPFDKLVADVTPDAKLRRLVRNMIYDGVLAFLLDIDLAEMEQALTSSSEEAQGDRAEPGRAASGFEYAEREPRQADPFRSSG